MRLGCCFTIGLMKGKGQTAHTYKPVILQVRSDKNQFSFKESHLEYL